MIYYSQRDPCWADYVYSAKPPHTETLRSAGCGVTCAASVAASLAGVPVTPPQMADYAVARGYRIDGVGTANALFPDVAERYGLECKETQNSKTAAKCVRAGGLAVCGTTGQPNRIFSTGGHFFLLAGAEGGRWKFWDPDCYAGKYAQYGREKYAEVKDGFVWVDRTIAAAEINRYFCFARKEKPMFEDVKEGDYAYKHIKALRELGIVNGDDAGNFRPDDPITRRDAAILIANALRAAGVAW